MKRKCTKCKKEFGVTSVEVETQVNNHEIHVVIICPHCGEDSEFAIIHGRDLIECE